MSTHSAALNLGGFAGRSGRPILAGLAATFASWRRDRARRIALSHLDDHLLDDIGLSRADVPHDGVFLTGWAIENGGGLPRLHFLGR